MKKRNIIVCSILIIIVVSIITIIINSESKKTFTHDGVTYALNVDGTPSTSFPTKGMYRVDVTCENGTGKWDYDNWKLYIENITGNVSCDMEFITISKEYFNNYIIGLSGTTQGNGEVVHEIATITTDNSTFTPIATLEQSSYAITNMETTSDSNDAFVWDGTNKNWTSQNHTASTTSNGGVGMSFTVPNGSYQLCYTMSSEKNFDYGTIYINGTEKFNTKGKDTSENCEYLGNLTASDVIRVAYRKDGSGDTGNDNIIFYLQSGTYNEDITTQSYDTGYRYEGQNPNNYVWFNNELWRIIGVFDSASHGVSDTYLVKIIRNYSIGGLVWDNDTTESSYGKNDWTTSDLMNLLNGAYYNQEDGTNGDYCYGYSTTSKAHCDYTNIGINSTYRSMIESVTWYLGGLSISSSDTNYYETTVGNYYTYERGTTVYSGRPTSTTGNIGLMYVSDYGFAALASSCARTTNLNAYSTASCTLANWLYGIGLEWTITPNSSDSYNVFSLSCRGYTQVNVAITGFAARPVLYLDSSVYVIDGSGTEADPYIIAD